MGASPSGVDLWRGGIVPYEINPDLANIDSIHQAIVHFEEQTNLRFVGRLSQDDYIRFSKQTRGNSNSEVGRQGGRQYVNASLNAVGVLVHEIGHAVGMMHEHQRDDRDDWVIFHEDRVTDEAEQYEVEDTGARTARYDFQSVMHYHAGDPANPIFESRTGTPAPADIGGHGTLTITDKTLLEAIYPAAPVIRRSDGEGGAGEVLHTSAIAVPGVNNTAVVANAIRNGSKKYQLVLWRVYENGVVVRMPDPPGSTGGKATAVTCTAIGSGLVSAMRDADGELYLISHGDAFQRLADSADQAGEVGEHHLLMLSANRVLTVCVSGSGRLLSIVWEIQSNGEIVRRFDSGTNGPAAASVSSVVVESTAGSQLVAILYRGPSRLVLSTWKVDGSSITFVADSKQSMGAGDLAHVIAAPTGHVVVVCRDASDRLLLIPFDITRNGAAVTRISGADGHAGVIREIAPIARPYGLLTSVISEGGHVLLIKWRVEDNGQIVRLGESGTQAGEGSNLSAAALPFASKVTVCTVVRNGSGDLLPITWDDVDGPGELTVV